MPVLDTLEPPVYQRIAGKAAPLRDLGLSDSSIARRPGVSDKTVAKAIYWTQRLGRQVQGDPHSPTRSRAFATISSDR